MSNIISCRDSISNGKSMKPWNCQSLQHVVGSNFETPTKFEITQGDGQYLLKNLTLVKGTFKWDRLITYNSFICEEIVRDMKRYSNNDNTVCVKLSSVSVNLRNILENYWAFLSSSTPNYKYFLILMHKNMQDIESLPTKSLGNDGDMYLLGIKQYKDAPYTGMQQDASTSIVKKKKSKVVSFDDRVVIVKPKPLDETGGKDSYSVTNRTESTRQSVLESPVSDSPTIEGEYKSVIVPKEAIVKHMVPKSDEELADEFYHFLLSSEGRRCSLTAAGEWFSHRTLGSKTLKLRLSIPKLGLNSNDGRFTYKNTSVTNDQLVEGYIMANEVIKETRVNSKRKLETNEVHETHQVNLIRNRRCNLPAWMTSKKDDQVVEESPTTIKSASGSATNDQLVEGYIMASGGSGTQSVLKGGGTNALVQCSAEEQSGSVKKSAIEEKSAVFEQKAVALVEKSAVHNSSKDSENCIPLEDKTESVIVPKEAIVKHMVPKSDEKLADEFYHFLLSSEGRRCSLTAAGEWFSHRTLGSKTLKLRLSIPKLGLNSNDGRFIYKNTSVTNDQLVEGYIMANEVIKETRVNSKRKLETNEVHETHQVNLIRNRRCNLPAWMTSKKDDQVVEESPTTIKSASGSALHKGIEEVNNLEEDELQQPVNLVRNRRCNLPAWMTSKKDDQVVEEGPTTSKSASGSALHKGIEEVNDLEDGEVDESNGVEKDEL